MKRRIALILLLLTSLTWAQKGEKIKGSKIVTIEKKEIDNFESIEVGDNIEVFLEKGDKTELKIEADDNLQSVIKIDLSDNILRLNTNKTVVNYKKLIVRITYTNDLKMVITKNESVVNALQEIQLEDITFKSFNESKLNLNVNSRNFLIQSDDKSKIELNLKSENAIIELSKNATLIALIATAELKCDLYQKGKANLEGDVNNAVIRLDNNSDFIAQKLIVKNFDLTAEGYSNSSINCNSNLRINASGNSEVKIYGDQKIEINGFEDSATLIKKPTK
ncbi:GIN domain-containing protein [Flavobacterium sp.]|uniref:GIN domain-containing protein n=1 Tax=Flavobacterium sp. TaxID=239 RepID=UPI0038FCE436